MTLRAENMALKLEIGSAWLDYDGPMSFVQFGADYLAREFSRLFGGTPDQRAREPLEDEIRRMFPMHPRDNDGHSLTKVDLAAAEARLFGVSRHAARAAALGAAYGLDRDPADWRHILTPRGAISFPRLIHPDCRCTTGGDMKKIKHRKPNKLRTLNHCVIGETVIPGKNIDRTWLAGEKEAVAHATTLLRRKVDNGDDRIKKLLVVKVVRVVEIRETPVVSRAPKKGEFDVDRGPHGTEFKILFPAHSMRFMRGGVR